MKVFAITIFILLVIMPLVIIHMAEAKQSNTWVMIGNISMVSIWSFMVMLIPNHIHSNMDKAHWTELSFALFGVIVVAGFLSLVAYGFSGWYGFLIKGAISLGQ